MGLLKPRWRSVEDAWRFPLGFSSVLFFKKTRPSNRSGLFFRGLNPEATAADDLQGGEDVSEAPLRHREDRC